MEGIVNIKKTKEDIERCKKIVALELKEELEDGVLEALTEEIMDTSLFIGGDFSDNTICELTKQYLETGGIKRFKKVYKVQ